MVRIRYVAPGGIERLVEVSPGVTLMEAAVKHGVTAIEGECGGACACATCHVYVAQDWYDKLTPPSEAEIDMLDMALAVEPTSRLSCQLTCSPELDGLTVTVAPE